MPGARFFGLESPLIDYAAMSNPKRQLGLPPLETGNVWPKLGVEGF